MNIKNAVIGGIIGGVVLSKQIKKRHINFRQTSAPAIVNNENYSYESLDESVKEMINKEDWNSLSGADQKTLIDGKGTTETYIEGEETKIRVVAKKNISEDAKFAATITAALTTAGGAIAMGLNAKKKADKEEQRKTITNESTKTQSLIDETRKAVEDTNKALQDTNKALQDTNNAVEETKKAVNATNESVKQTSNIIVQGVIASAKVSETDVQSQAILQAVNAITAKEETSIPAVYVKNSVDGSFIDFNIWFDQRTRTLDQPYEKLLESFKDVNNNVNVRKLDFSPDLQFNIFSELEGTFTQDEDGKYYGEAFAASMAKVEQDYKSLDRLIERFLNLVSYSYDNTGEASIFVPTVASIVLTEIQKLNDSDLDKLAEEINNSFRLEFN
jgi:ElaB/YqjD/DUF883 family membrane-anchored ribosome-binding protein